MNNQAKKKIVLYYSFKDNYYKDNLYKNQSN